MYQGLFGKAFFSVMKQILVLDHTRHSLDLHPPPPRDFFFRVPETEIKKGSHFESLTDIQSNVTTVLFVCVCMGGGVENFSSMMETLECVHKVRRYVGGDLRQ